MENIIEELDRKYKEWESNAQKKEDLEDIDLYNESLYRKLEAKYVVDKHDVELTNHDMWEVPMTKSKIRIVKRSD